MTLHETSYGTFGPLVDFYESNFGSLKIGSEISPGNHMFGLVGKKPKARQFKAP